jgi:hypothetical protein
MKLFKYYNIDECQDKDELFEKLNEFKSDGKIEYYMDGTQIFELEDIDLEESDITDINELFDNLDVFPYLENGSEDEDEEDYDDYDEENDDY